MAVSLMIPRVAAAGLAALVLCLPAAWNGQPLLYPDTPTYLRGAEAAAVRLAGDAVPLRPWVPPTTSPSPSTSPAASSLTSLEDKVVLAGRSVYYGAALYASYLAGSLWWAVIAQAGCVAWLLQLLMLRLWHLPPLTLVATAGALAVATPLGAYTGLLMPDVFAGLTVLAIAALTVYWRRLDGGERCMLTALLLFSLITHASHVAIALGVGLVALALRQRRPDWMGLSLPALGMVGACLVMALAAEWAFGQAVTRGLGEPPLRLPHTMARLIDEGPGTVLLRRTCPQSGYAACTFVGHYPTAWTDFLFSTDPQRGAFALADAATKRRLAGEQGRFVIDVLRADPAGVIGGMARDAALQLLQFRVDIWGYGPRELGMYTGRVPPAVMQSMVTSRCAGTTRCNEVLSVLTYAGVLWATAVALHATRRRARGDAAVVPQRFEQLAWLVIAGVVTNALVCATLAAPLDRFQSRVIWLLPFLALCAVALSWAAARRPAMQPRPPRAPQATTPPLWGAAP